MPAPGEADTGGNPLQEGILAKPDGGWQNRMKRDESFASVKEATVPEFVQQNAMGIAPDKQYDSSDEYWKKFKDRGWQNTLNQKAEQAYKGEELAGGTFDTPWQQGGQGRGLIMPDGQIHTWPEEHGTHEQYLQAKGLPMDPLPVFFGISPEGHYQPLGREPSPEHMDLVSQHGIHPPKEEDDDWGDDLDFTASVTSHWHLDRMEPHVTWHMASDEEFETDQVILPGPATEEVDVGQDNPLILQHDSEQVVQDARTKIEAATKMALLPALAVGAASLLGGSAAKGIAGKLMGGALGSGIGGAIGGMLGIGGEGQAAPPPPIAALPPQYMSAFEHPSSNPNIPSDDPKEFRDGEKGPLQSELDVNDIGGTDSVEGLSNADGIPLDSPEGETFLSLLPLILRFAESEEPGIDNPILKALDDMLEQQMPGYKDAEPNEDEAKILDELLRTWKEDRGEGKPAPDEIAPAEHVANNPIGYQPPQGPPAAGPTPPTGIVTPPQPPQPGGPSNPMSDAGCAHCGARIPSGQMQCPQCGGSITPGTMGMPVDPSQAPGVGGGVSSPLPAAGGIFSNRTADTQGPHNAEQIAAVAELLQEQGRAEEIPEMIRHPEAYAEELAQIQQTQTPPESLNEEIQPPPPPGMMPPGADPMMGGGMPPGGPPMGPPGGGPPMMASTKRAEIHHHEELHPHEETLGVPAADQIAQEDVSQEQDTTHAWSTDEGEPLKVGQEYEMYATNYEIPDIVRITAVKPDSVEYALTGEYNMEQSVELDRQEAISDGITFRLVGTSDAEDEAIHNRDSTTPVAPGEQHDLSSPGIVSSTAWLNDGTWEPTKTAGKKYTPMEQREFIDEQGVARNSDKLKLEGTHYEAALSNIEDDFLFGL